MKLKKLVTTIISISLLFSVAACGGEKEQPKKEEQTVVKEEPKPERVSLVGEEVVEKFPKLKEMEEYLFNQYPTLSREAQERGKQNEDRQPIDFYYVEDGKFISLQVSLTFKQSAAKKEMIDAIKYVSKEIDNLFLENSKIHFRIRGLIGFTEDGILDENMIRNRGLIILEYDKPKKGQEANFIWKEEKELNKPEIFDPEEVKEGEELAYFGEEEQPAPLEKTSGITIDEIIGMLKENEADYGMNVEEFTREKEEETKHVISKGGNKEGSYTFEITANEYERAISGIYKVKRLPEMNDEAFKKECMTYLRRAATSQYTSAVKVSVYRYMGEVIEYIMTGEEPRTEFMAENTKFEIVSEEEGNCIAVYVTSYAEKYEQ